MHRENKQKCINILRSTCLKITNGNDFTEFSLLKFGLRNTAD